VEKKVDLFWLAYVRLHHSAKKRRIRQDKNYGLMFVKKGPVLMEVDGRERLVKEGEYLCLPQGTTYSIYHLPNKGIEYYFLRFTLTDPFLEEHLRRAHPPLAADRSTETKFDYLSQNWNSKDAHSQAICENFLLSLLMLLFVGELGCDEGNPKFILAEEYGETTRRILYYIENNFFSQFTLEDMGKTLGYNKSYLSAVFSKETGKSVIEYANFIRVRTAIVIFFHFPYSVSVTAERVGFNSLSYFSRTFKAFTGVSPGDFLKGVSGMEEAERFALVNETSILNAHPCTMEEAFSSVRRLGEIVGNAKE